MSRRGTGIGRGGTRQGVGGPRNCTCTKCGKKVPHRRGSPCTGMRCPMCGSRMVGT